MVLNGNRFLPLNHDLFMNSTRLRRIYVIHAVPLELLAIPLAIKTDALLPLLETNKIGSSVERNVSCKDTPKLMRVNGLSSS